MGRIQFGRARTERRNGIEGEALISNALLDRVARSLFLSRQFPVDLLGFCWDPNDEKSNRHLGVIFRVQIDNDSTANDLKKKEFRRGRGHSLAGRFVEWQSLTPEQSRENLESWSLSILNNLQDIGGIAD